MTLKDKLIKEGKYNQIVITLEKIVKMMKPGVDHPVRWQFDFNSAELIRYVKSEDVLAGIAIYKYMLQLDKELIKTTDLLQPFYMYVDSYYDMLMHNYANAIVRESEPEEEYNLESIRTWTVLYDSLTEIIFNLL